MKIIVILFYIVVFHTNVIFLASLDSEQLQDFCIPHNHSSQSILFNPCKNTTHVTVEDFIFSGIKSPGKSNNGFSGVSVTSTVFPGLNTLGMSFVRADFDIGAINVPHYHPRATETAFLLKGQLYSGFVDSQNKVFAKVIEEGEVMVFPKGLVHFQMNVGDRKATILGSFNSENPGVVRIPGSVFGSGIDEELLEKAFGLNSKDIVKMKKKLGVKEHK